MAPVAPASAKRSLLDLGAGVRVDFQPYGNLDDDRGLPLHGRCSQSDVGMPETKVAVRYCQPTARRRLERHICDRSGGLCTATSRIIEDPASFKIINHISPTTAGR